jgi:hypothetical protein
LGYDGTTPKFRIGNPAGAHMQWDGGNLTVNSPRIEGDGLIITSPIGLRYASDAGVFTITGGSDNGANHGAQIDLAGNLLGTAAAGVLVLSSGDVATAEIHFRTDGNFRGRVTNGGTLDWDYGMYADGLIESASGFRAPNGSTSSPAYAFANHTNSGIRDRGDGSMGFVVGGVEKLVVRNGAVALTEELKLNKAVQAIGLFTVTGYIDVLDSSGNVVHLATVS